MDNALQEIEQKVISHEIRLSIIEAQHIKQNDALLEIQKSLSRVESLATSIRIIAWIAGLTFPLIIGAFGWLFSEIHSHVFKFVGGI